MKSNKFNTLFNQVILDYQKWQEAVREARNIEYFDYAKKAFGVFENENSEKYEAFFDAVTGKFSCDCDYFIKKGRMCKHCKMLAMLLLSELDIKLSYLKLGHFYIKYHYDDGVRYYEIIRGKVIMRNFDKRQ